ncbi:sulfotransferase domain-containing protein [Planktomarina temperata]|nr:sulfotransferase domain-containing protein [Planktomarina temperata]
MLQKNSFLWHTVNTTKRLVYSKIMPSLIVLEHPKYRGTWLSQMLTELTDFEFPKNKTPRLQRNIYHSHRLELLKKGSTIFLTRDPRDMVISQFYYLSRVNNKYNSRIHRRFVSRFSDIKDINDPGDLTKFIDVSFNVKPHGYSWTDFVDQLIDQPKVSIIRYEDLLNEPEMALSTTLAKLGIDFSPDKLSQVVERNSFQSLTGRRPGNEVQNDFLRKGIVGDHKNNFHTEHYKKMEKYCGKYLKRLAYE